MHRWRTQPAAISSVNCRTQRIIESLNANGAPWFSREHVCLSVMSSTYTHSCCSTALVCGVETSRPFTVSEWLRVFKWSITAPNSCSRARAAKRNCPKKHYHTACLSSQRRTFEEVIIPFDLWQPLRVACWKQQLDFFLDFKLWFWPQIRQDYPLNLSILISGGKETNKDSLSNGEWSGNGSSLKSLLLATANCSLEKRFPGGSILPKLLGTAHQRGWQSRLWQGRPFMIRFLWVGLLGNAAQNWW